MRDILCLLDTGGKFWAGAYSASKTGTGLLVLEPRSSAQTFVSIDVARVSNGETTGLYRLSQDAESGVTLTYDVHVISHLLVSRCSESVERWSWPYLPSWPLAVPDTLSSHIGVKKGEHAGQTKSFKRSG